MNDARDNRGRPGSFITRSLVGLLLSMTILEAAAAGTGAVFIATNPAGRNEIVMFDRAEDGTLTLRGSFPTRGDGSGPDVLLKTDPLGSQGSIAVDEVGRYLFAVNAGSNDVSVFRISQKDGLKFVQKADSGGTFPVSLTVRNNVLYVLNAAYQSSFKGFRVDPGTGRLSKLPGGECNLLSPLNLPETEVFANPSQISFTPDGNKLVIVNKQGLLVADLLPPLVGGHEGPRPTQGPGRIDVYALNNDGAPVDCASPAVTPLRTDPTRGSMPFASTFSESGHLLVAEVLGNFLEPNYPLGTSAMSSYRIKADGTLEPNTLSLPNAETAMCWMARSGKYVYAANQASNTISKYKVSPAGELELVNAQEKAIPGGGLVDMAITADGSYLYQLAPGDPQNPNATGKIHAYRIDNGKLTSIGDAVDIPGAPVTGQAGMAVVDFAN